MSDSLYYKRIKAEQMLRQWYDDNVSGKTMLVRVVQ